MSIPVLPPGPVSSPPLPENGGRPPLPFHEQWLIAVTAAHLCFLPWALGTMHAWSQLTSLGLATLGFILALLRGTGGSSRPRFFRQPVFWATLAFLSYVTVQALNPSWQLQSNADVWWLEPVAHIAWLPTGIDAPFERASPWRALTVFSSVALLTSSVWLGFRRRKSYHTLFTVLVLNATLLALLGLAQQVTSAQRIFWSYVSSNDWFVASFIYPNHAGPYFNLMVALAVSLAWWHHRRVHQQLESAGATLAFAAAAGICSSVVLFSSSRLSSLLLAVLGLAVLGNLGLRLLRRTGPWRQRAEFRPTLVMFALLAACSVAVFASEKISSRFATAFAAPGSTLRSRTLARQAAADMLGDYWLTGWGAGCFRYGFPKYTKKYPEIYLAGNGQPFVWEHAHDDLLEFPVELGVAGLLPLAVIFAAGVRQFVRRRAWKNVVTRVIVLGGALVFLHAEADFVFQNPAVLLTWSVLLVAALRWAELDHPGQRPPARSPPLP